MFIIVFFLNVFVVATTVNHYHHVSFAMKEYCVIELFLNCLLVLYQCLFKCNYNWKTLNNHSNTKQVGTYGMEVGNNGCF